MSPEFLQTRLSKLQSADDLRSLFADLSYEARFDDVFLESATKADQKAQENLVGQPEIIAASDEFRVIYARLADWDRAVGSQRALIGRLLSNFPFALWIFSDASGQKWHFVNVKRGGKTVTRDGKSSTRHVLRRISLGTGRKPGRTVCDRIARLDLQKLDPSLFGLSGLQIQNAYDGAFDVEAVTKEFYNGYRRVVRQLQMRLKNQQENDPEWAHALALQMLNRMMFLRFIEKKEAEGQHWLGDDPEWSLSFWKTYQKQKTDETDEFYLKWLRPLFFEAFNNSFDPSAHPHFSPDVQQAFEDAPYLNGGLFKENELDKRHAHSIPDSFFALLFDEFEGQRPGFFERFNFTITEDSPFDQEVAVDPEMIGHVYESLINLSELVGEESDQATGDERGDHGIFYTQRVEIDLMCRLALGDYLFNHLSKLESAPADLRDVLLEWVFAYEPAEKVAADARVTELDLWGALDVRLRSVTVCDPACGSGAFLVGMLAILSDLSTRTNAALIPPERPYDLCRRLIQNSLYGVDVMDWAVHVAELRLWLQLVIENDTNPRARKNMEAPEPLLPNLSFKVRRGDSLVQELGGVTVALGDQIQIPTELRPRLTQLRTKKRKFFNASEASQITQREIEADEKNLFADVLRAKRDQLRRELGEIEKERNNPILFATPTTKQIKEWDSKAANFALELKNIESASLELDKPAPPPFVWRIAFFEIFDGKPQDAGFDIVVGNPPYVRQEKIAPPDEREDKHTPSEWKARKEGYKAKLQRSVQGAWPEFFETGKKTERKLDGKSDLYIYFFLHGLKLLAPGGAFCFITSNSWLDVGYGGDLQEFLLKYGRVRAVFDNEVKRSFKSADVNTAVALLGRGEKSPKDNASALARFVMWRVPFEAASNALVWSEIEASGGRLVREEFRLRPFSQAELIQDGADAEKPELYAGNKWGGKFLRAPAIYDVILEKGKDRLVRLDSVANVRRGFTTGSNEFFYLDRLVLGETKSLCRNGFGWEGEIENEFLIAVVKTPKQITSLELDLKDLSTCAFVCNLDKKALKGKLALKYIEWGEKQVSKGHQGKQKNGISLPELQTFAARKFWYGLGDKEPCNFLCNRFFNDRLFFAYPEVSAVEDQTFYGGNFKRAEQRMAQLGLLNCTIQMFFAALLGRVGLGEGVLQYAVYEMQSMTCLDASQFTFGSDFEETFKVMSHRKILSIFGEVLQTDRQALDSLIFDALNLSMGEREAVYEAVVNSVENRLKKAGSLKILEA